MHLYDEPLGLYFNRRADFKTLRVLKSPLSRIVPYRLAWTIEI